MSETETESPAGDPGFPREGWANPGGDINLLLHEHDKSWNAWGFMSLASTRHATTLVLMNLFRKLPLMVKLSLKDIF